MAAALLIENFYSSFQMYLQDLGVECGGHPKEFQLPFVVRITLKYAKIVRKRNHN